MYLKMGHMTLFTHLKIILLQCFQFSVSVKISSIQTDPILLFYLNELIRINKLLSLSKNCFYKKYYSNLVKSLGAIMTSKLKFHYIVYNMILEAPLFPSSMVFIRESIKINQWRSQKFFLGGPNQIQEINFNSSKFYHIFFIVLKLFIN